MTDCWRGSLQATEDAGNRTYLLDMLAKTMPNARPA
jgi:hypothetical protein